MMLRGGPLSGGSARRLGQWLEGKVAVEGSKGPAVHVHRDIRARLPLDPNPVLVQHARERAEGVQNRIADWITEFAGSMLFVYIHIVWFACWIGFGAERYPYGLLTMIVSLEAIFLSTFVMISQNRADAKRQIIANQQWATVQEEDRQNNELLAMSRQILDLTKQMHQLATATSQGAASEGPGRSD